MLTRAKVSEIVRGVASANLTSSAVRAVMSEPTTDSQGADAWRVTIVIEPGSEERLKGDAVLTTLVEIQDRLQAEGEDRFAFVEYATMEELEQSGDP